MNLNVVTIFKRLKDIYFCEVGTVPMPAQQHRKYTVTRKYSMKGEGEKGCRWQEFQRLAAKLLLLSAGQKGGE